MAVVYTKKEKTNIILRLILLAILLIVIVVCIAIVVNQMKVKKGLKRIVPDYSKYQSKIADYNFYYYLNKTDKSLSVNHDTLKYNYSAKFDYISELVDIYQEYDGINNLYYINNNPNTQIEVDEILYNYLKMIYDYNKDYILLAPIYTFWQDLLYSIDTSKGLLDPIKSSANKALIDNYMTNSKDKISLTFLDDNKIILNVSDDYEKINDIYISFGIFEQAVIMDYIKNEITKLGYNDGYIISSLGFYLDFGSSSFNKTLTITSKTYNRGFHTIDIKPGYSYVNTYNYIFNNYYPLYEVDDIVRTPFINYNTGYTIDVNTELFISNNSIIDCLNQTLNYYLNDTKTISYLYEKDNKIFTNISELTSSLLEVVYEN